MNNYARIIMAPSGMTGLRRDIGTSLDSVERIHVLIDATECQNARQRREMSRRLMSMHDELSFGAYCVYSN